MIRFSWRQKYEEDFKIIFSVDGMFYDEQYGYGQRGRPF